jgi:hypothetical protein
MKNLLSITARVSSDTGRENGLDDLHSFVGEEVQLWIFLAIS